MSTAFDRFVGALERRGKVKSTGQSKVSAQCPSHDDTNPSLSVTGIEGQVLIHCHGGCRTDQVLDALGMTNSDLFDDKHGVDYVYVDRTVTRTPAKKFRQKLVKDAEPGPHLYHLGKLSKAKTNGATVYLVEGEKDVHAIEAVGGFATTAPMGAANIGKADLTRLYDMDVVAVVDNDQAGEKWAATVHQLLDGKAKSLRFVHAATGKDAADHIAAGHGPSDFVPIEIATNNDDVDLRRARITWASEIEPEPVVWAWETAPGEGRIPAGSLTIAAGREGTGKSSFGIWKAAHITNGTLPGAYYGTPRKVFYVAVEDSWKHTLVPRLMAAGADLNMIGRFEVVSVDDDELTLSLPHDNALLEREVSRHHVALVVIDPLMSVIGEKIDTHREREVRSALDPLAKMADRTGSIFLGIAHFNKGGGTDAASLITGSGAFKNVPRSVFGFARDDSDADGGRVMSQVKNSLGRDDLDSLTYKIESFDVDTKKGIATTGKFVFTGTTDRSVADVLRESRLDQDTLDEAKDAGSWIESYLKDCGDHSAIDIEVLDAGVAAGYKKGTLRNARKKVASTKSAGFGRDKVTTWTLRSAQQSRQESQASRPLEGVIHVNDGVIHGDAAGPTCFIHKVPAPGGKCPECQRVAS